jgi:hypothetical protein
VIRLLFEGVAPERALEFERFFAVHQPQFFISKRARAHGGFCALETSNHILSAPNMRDALWFLSFAAWYAFRARIPQEALAALLPPGPMHDELLLSEDLGYQPEAAACHDIATLAIELVRKPVAAGTLWPEAVPFPRGNRKSVHKWTPQKSSSNVAWVFLLGSLSCTR